MKILVVGGGGREHAIIRALKKSPDCGEIWCAPGNGGIGYDATCKNISATDVDAMVAFAKAEAFDYVVVAQDDPLALGMVDALAKVGIPAFGPDAAAARIDGNIERLLHALTVVFLKFVEELKLRNLRRCRQTGRLFQHLAELFRGKIDSLGVSLAIQRNLETNDIDVMLLCRFLRQIAGGVRQNDILVHALLPFAGPVLRSFNRRISS